MALHHIGYNGVELVILGARLGKRGNIIGMGF